jgi:PDZ domain-containing protein
VIGGGLVLLLATAAVLWIWPSDEFLFLPESAQPVAPLVSVKGGKDAKGPGGIYYDAVVIRRAKLFEQLFPWIHDGVTLVPEEQVNPPGANDRQRRTEDLREMARSQDIAGAVALKYLGYDVTIRSIGVLVTAVLANSPAVKAGLQPTDVIVALDGATVRTPIGLRRLMSRHKPGDPVRLTIRNGSGLRQVRIGTVADPRDRNRPFIGIFTDQATEVRLPVAVRIDAGSIGGPSAGLAFALDVLEELGHNVDRGYKIAATGELAADGSVIPIGGVKQKTIGARRAHVDIFLVPAGQNAKDARKYAGDMRVIAVDSFRQALQVLATLHPKR